MSDALPSLVRTFVSDHVHSVGELELLMLLHSGGDRVWTADELCTALGAPTPWARTRLQLMAAGGLIATEPDGWRYAPRTSNLRRALDAVADAYATRRRELVRHIFSKPAE